MCRKLIADVVQSTGVGTVKHVASNGANALEWLKQEDIDVVLLDTVMPEMDGIETLKAIREEHPDVEIIMLNSGGAENSALIVEALRIGAMDFIVKPVEANSQKNIEYTVNQIKVLLAQINIKKISSTKRSETQGEKSKTTASITNTDSSNNTQNGKKILSTGVDLIVIASSTGGPAALEMLCTGISADICKPILIVQHMPPEFTKVLAQTLDQKCKMMVTEGKEGDIIIEGQIIIAPGGLHMIVDTSKQIYKIVRLESTPYVNGVRPSADILFGSVAQIYRGRNILAVILTGMGNDGMKGVMELKQKCNCYCITQSEESCVVYGMPRSVYEAGLSDEVVKLEQISRRIQQIAFR